MNSPTIIIADLANVYVDGVNVGQPADAIANNPQWASGIQTALTAYFAQLQSQLAATQANLAAAEAELSTLRPPEEPTLPPEPIVE